MEFIVKFPIADKAADMLVMLEVKLLIIEVKLLIIAVKALVVLADILDDDDNDDVTLLIIVEVKLLSKVEVKLFNIAVRLDLEVAEFDPVELEVDVLLEVEVVAV